MSELNFTVPKLIFQGDKQIRYPFFDKLKLKYLIRCVAEWGTGYYVIDAPAFQNEADTWSVHAYALPYQLQGKKVYGFSTTQTVSTTDSSGEATTEDVDTPITIEAAMNTVLANCYSWSIGHIDDSLSAKTGSFSLDDVTVLDAITQVASTFNALVKWDTVNNQVNFYDTESWQGTNRGFTISEKRYLSSLEEDLSLDGLVTRLHLKGSDSVNAADGNPTGQDYIEDYSYFLGNYAEDENGNVLSHSDFMTDSLCHALLAYKQKIADNTDTFNGYASDLATNEATLSSLQSDLSTYQSQLTEIQDKVNSATTDNNYFYLSKLYNGVGWSYSATLDDSNKYIIIAKASSVLSATIDGNTYSVGTSWKVVKKIGGQTDTDFVLTSGQNTADVSVIIISIDDDEYSTSGNEDILNFTYNIYEKQDEIAAKQAEIDTVNININNDKNNITNINNILGINKNFTQAQLEELDQFILDETYSNTDLTSASDLMSAGKIQLASMQMPSDSFSVSLINFLQIVECQKDWNRLYLNDIVTINYDNEMKVKANVNEMDFDFSQGSINLIISNLFHVKDEINKFVDVINQTKQAAQKLNAKEAEWNSITATRKRLDNFLRGNISLNNHALVGGLNSSETMDGLGYKSSYDENNYLRIYKGCIVSTNDGGNTWSALFTPSGVNAAQITGQLLIDENTSIVSSDGSTQITNSGATLSGSSTSITGGLPSSQIDSTLVNNAAQGSFVKSQFDNLNIGGVNLAAKVNTFGNIIDINSNIGYSNYGFNLQYNTANGYETVPINCAGYYTLSFIAYSNLDDVELQMSLNTKTTDDLTADHSIIVGTSSRKYQWTVNYQDADIQTKVTALKFWHVDIEAAIVVQDVQLEQGNIATAWRKSYLDS
jgi:hypothetical protein